MKKGQIIVGLVVMLFICFGVFIGVLHSREDRKRQHVIWSYDGVAEYVCPDSEGAVELRWHRDQLSVSSKGYGGRLADRMSLILMRRAIKSLNSQVGRRLLVEEVVGRQADISILWDVPHCISGITMYMRHYKSATTNDADLAQIGICAVGDDTVIYRMLLHGLGHAMGLADNNNDSRSIMYSHHTSRSLLDQPIFVTDADIALLMGL